MNIDKYRVAAQSHRILLNIVSEPKFSYIKNCKIEYLTMGDILTFLDMYI